MQEGTPYHAMKMWDSGNQEEGWFPTYEDMCRWLAASPEAGFNATDGGLPLDQATLQEDVQGYQ